MRMRSIFAGFLVLGVAACDDVLTVEPTNEVPDEIAIRDANSARAALAGAYDGLQDLSYYGGDLVLFGDLLSDNAIHTGTFTGFIEADDNLLRANNSTVEDIWDALYIAIGRTNDLIIRLPDVSGLSDEEKSEMLGQAHFLRALSYHNAVKLWGAPPSVVGGDGVPIRLEPPATANDASQISRDPTSAVYQQILDDLAQAEALITTETGPYDASLGAVHALRSRVFLYLSQWADVITEADAVEALGYELASSFPQLFTEEGSVTDEDIFRVSFTAVEFNNLGFYYFSRSFGGRREQAPSAGLDATYEAGDEREAWSISFDGSGRRYGSKFPTTAGAEDIHVIRFAEVLLNRAEAHARLNQLASAVADYNRVRVRAGLTPHVLGVHVTTQQQVIDAVLNERRLELAMEGDRWSDLVRTGMAVAVMGLADRPHQVLLPIPQNELDIAPNLVQNPGY